MAVLAYAETEKGKFKKSAYEAVYYGYKTSKILGCELYVLVLGEAANIEMLGNYGAGKVMQSTQEELSAFDSQVYTAAICNMADVVGADVIVLSNSSKGRSLLGRIAVRYNASAITGANSLPNIEDGFIVTKSVFSGKALEKINLLGERKVVSVMGNAISPEQVGNTVSVEQVQLELPLPKVEVLDVERVEGITPLPEAEMVVSAGRGVKDPSNWGIIEELAEVMGATTACSRPVADAGWRPHHEHVGQTGIAIRPNLYIAIGISGAIQHLAGVNNSKVIVVVNKDPEAPFFKAADYGVCADLFDVVPRLTEAVKRFKDQQN
jgi:electron transfer flavoprotein alpha subunit